MQSIIIKIAKNNIMLSEETCLEIQQCSNCTTSGCIWCGVDNGCHAGYSPDSCISPVTCDDLQECMRSEPEYLNYTDYAHANLLIAIITVIAAVLLLSCLWIILHRFKKYRKKKIMRHHRDTDVQMEKYLNTSFQSLYENDERFNMDEFIPYGNSSFATNPVSNIKRLTETDPLITRRAIKRDKYIKCSCKCMCCLSLAIIFISSVIIILFPTVPAFDTCNTETDWAEIWSSLMQGSVQSKYSILFSIKNDNYLSVQMTDLSAEIYYEKSLIGYWYPENDADEVYIPSHALVDVMAKVTFVPTVSQALTLYNLYEANALHLEIKMMGKTKTYLLNKNNNLKLFDEYFNLDKKDFLIGASIKTNRRNCNCAASQ